MRLTLNLRRAAYALAALSLASVAFQEARLRLTCPQPVERDLTELSADAAEGPAWVRVKAEAPPVDALLITTPMGNDRGAWIPLVAPGEPRTVVAVVHGDDDDVIGLQAVKGPAHIEGLAYFPTRDDLGDIRQYLGSLKLKATPNLRVIELGREPHGYSHAAVLYLLGCLVAALALFDPKYWPNLRFGGSGEEADTPHELPALEVEPLAEETKFEVEQMLDDAWQTAQRVAQ